MDKEIAQGWVAAAPAAMALAMALLGLGAWDYHLALAVAPVTAWAAAVAMGRWLRGTAGLAGPAAMVGLGPLAVAAVATWWQPACNVLDSLGLWLLGPVCAGLWGLGVGALAALAPGPRRARGALATLLVAAAVPGAVHFLASPQIYVYLPHTGRIAGALYEDAVAAGWRDVAYRLADLAWTLPVLAVAAQLRTRDQPWSVAGLRRAARADRAVVWAFVTAVAAVAIGLGAAGVQRWRTPRSAFDAALPVAIQVAGPGGVAVTVHGPRGRRWQLPLQQLRDDVAFRHHQLTGWFGHATLDIALYAWPDAASKRAWTGAHRVEMAKPWLRQVHMVLPEYGSTTLTHELAHVFAARWAGNPLGVALGTGWLPDALLIEGVAVAAEWPVRGGLDPHGWARAARLIGKAPPLDGLGSSAAFLRMNPDLAYTLAGSLLRFVGDSCGSAGLARAYGSGKLASACDRPLAEVLRSWANFVDDPTRPQPSAADLERARARFEPAGLFDRPCALAVGRCRDRAGTDHLAGNDRAARDAWLRLLAALPASTERLQAGVVLDAAAADSAAGHAAAATATLQDWLTAQLARPAAAAPNRLTLAAARSVLGDLHWQAGALARAEAAWRDAAQAPVDEGMARTLAVKLHFARLPGAAPLLRHVLCAGGPMARTDPLIEALPTALPGDPVALALHGRRALRFGDPEQGLVALREVLPKLREEHPWMFAEVVRAVGLALAWQGRCAELDGLRPDLAPPALARETKERCKWSAAKPHTGQD